MSIGFSLATVDKALENILLVFMISSIFFVVVAVSTTFLCTYWTGISSAKVLSSSKGFLLFILACSESCSKDFDIKGKRSHPLCYSFCGVGGPAACSVYPKGACIMRDYEKCIHCDCYNADYGQAESNGSIIDACALCDMTEEDWRKFEETVE